MSAQLDALTAQVETNRTVTGSAIVLIQGLAAHVAEVQAELAAQGIDNAKLNELAAGLAGQDTALADAIAANTPAAPPADGGGGTTTPPADDGGTTPPVPTP